MKGMVFNIFSDLVSDQFGLDVWDALIDRTNPASGAIYSGVDVYPDGELMAYVAELSELTATPAADLVRAFGMYTMHRFTRIHPEFLEGHSAKTFLESVHDIIHVEVKKLHPDALLPDFQYESSSENDLTMIYSSPRKLCYLAEGLIKGAGEIFSQGIEIQHNICMHNGAAHCRLELDFERCS